MHAWTKCCLFLDIEGAKKICFINLIVILRKYAESKNLSELYNDVMMNAP